MVKIYDFGDFPPSKHKLKWYVGRLCARLLQQDEIGDVNIEVFWAAIRKKQGELPSFHWLRENLAQEAKQQLDELLAWYQYDPRNRAYKRKQIRL